MIGSFSSISMHAYSIAQKSRLCLSIFSLRDSPWVDDARSQNINVLLRLRVMLPCRQLNSYLFRSWFGTSRQRCAKRLSILFQHPKHHPESCPLKFSFLYTRVDCRLVRLHSHQKNCCVLWRDACSPVQSATSSS